MEPSAVPWELLDERIRGARFFRLPARRLLNSPASTHMRFWSLNPYVGCEFGCSYCYARDTHRYTVERALGSGTAPGSLPVLPPAESFEKNILVKDNAPALLLRELASGRLGADCLVIGSATDPYQPAERDFRVTRGILEALAQYRGLNIELITKSALVTRDGDLLARISRQSTLRIHISLATVHRRLARRLEARTPVPAVRLRALAQLRALGVDAGVLIAPIVPGITDSTADLALLMQAARDAGANYVAGSALRLGPAARRNFLPMLRREFPRLVPRYERAYARSESAPRAYQHALAARIERLKRHFGFRSSRERFEPLDATDQPPHAEQTSLF